MMQRILFSGCGLGYLLIFVCLGCNVGMTGPAPSPAPSTTGNPPAGGTTSTGGGGSVGQIDMQQSVYVVQDGHMPSSVLVFPRLEPSAGAPLEIPGTQVSVDAAGDIYVLAPDGKSINEYSADAPLGHPLRSIPVGQGTKIPVVQDVMASATGEIFVSDGKGIAVFSSTATGNADPSRYIQGVTQSGQTPSRAIVPGIIVVDHVGNLYVQDQVDNSIAVFGPTDTGQVTPSRTIATLSGAKRNTLTGMAVDTSGNLYVLCLCEGHGFGVLEFGPGAKGGDAPIRYVSDPIMDPYFFNDGIAVGADGTIFVSAGYPSGAPALFGLPPTASGSADVGFSIDYDKWTDAPSSRIAVH